MNKEFKARVDQRELVVGIIGLGYVGLPLAVEFIKQGFPTIGFDIDSTKVERLLAGESYIKHIPAETVAGLNESGRFDATTDFSRLGEAEVILICVPTPLTEQREPDMSYINSTAEKIWPQLRKDHLVILESTTYPGTTEEVLLPLLEKSGLHCGEDFYLAYSPEREDPGNKKYSTSKIPKVVGADTDEALLRAVYIYHQIVVDVVPVSSAKTAEAVKITENIFRCVNIALVNELKVIYAKMGIDIWEVIDAAATKPFGFMPFYPGPGLGGHCIPIDPFYLTWKAREFQSPTKFIELAGEINTAMPALVVQELMNGLNDAGKALKNSSVLIIGLAYKQDVDDLRESPSLKLIELIQAKGGGVDYHDPFIPELQPTRDYPGLAGMASVDLTAENVAGYDAVLIATAHTRIDYVELVKQAQLVIDTRNATKDVTEGREKIIKA